MAEITSVAYLEKREFCRALQEARSNSLDFIVVITAALDPADTAGLKACLDECVRVLKDGGLLFVQGVLSTYRRV